MSGEAPDIHDGGLGIFFTIEWKTAAWSSGRI